MKCRDLLQGRRGRNPTISYNFEAKFGYEISRNQKIFAEERQETKDLLQETRGGGGAFCTHSRAEAKGWKSADRERW